MQIITVNTAKKYDIYVGEKLLELSGKIIRERSNAKKAVIVTDDIVDKLYSQTLINSLLDSGFVVEKFVFLNGEKSKSHATLIALYDFLAQKNVTRTDLIVALGGGVVGDLAGFAAGTYLRGIDVVQIPTTLLAQTDSSIGGKTAVDICGGKNLVGVFKQPLCVITDINTLDTLSDDIFEDGMAEIIKYAMIKNKELFFRLLNENAKKFLLEIISQCINIKREIVENDEFDKGERMLLNFGHTLGHSIEKYGNFTQISHGKAVAIGMVMITKIAVAENLSSKAVLTELVKCLQKYNLPFNYKISKNALVEGFVNDKKRESDLINIIVCEDFGCGKIVKIPVKKLARLVEGI